eukprot:2353692-Amphidinium_carterae.1
MTQRRQIQETAQTVRDSTYDEPPPSGAQVEGGRRNLPYETDDQLKVNVTVWAVLFDMVAELAMWQAELAI